jgi:hypothetical protein
MMSIATAQTLRLKVVLDRLDEFQRLVGTGAPTNIEGGKSQLGDRAQILVLSPGVLEVSGKSHKVGAKRWKFTLLLGPLGDVQRGDELSYCVDATGGSALALKRGDEVRFILGNVADVAAALEMKVPDGLVHAKVAAGSAHARADLAANPEELAYWLGHYVGGRSVDAGG